MAIAFEDVLEGQPLFIPGLGQMARVLRIVKMGKRVHQIVLLLDGGREVTHRRSTWFATHPHEAPAAHRDKAVPGDEANTPQAARQPFGAGVAVSLPTSTQRKATQKPQTPPLKKEWPLSLPDIPGPPVPKPLADVWSDEVLQARARKAAMTAAQKETHGSQTT